LFDLDSKFHVQLASLENRSEYIGYL